VPLLLLDLDNTLADREAAFCAWLDAKLAAWAPGDTAARAFVVAEDADGLRPRRELLALVRERFGVGESIDDLLDEYRRLTLACFPPLGDAVRGRLAGLRHAGWKLAVVTNGEAGVQEATAERIGLAPLLDACVVSGAVGVRKPDPRIFALAAEACGEPLDGAWMIGDGEADILGAARAGIRSVWLARGRAWHRADVRPDQVADGIEAALGLAASHP
jgi:HAD superfamily hydrolase (TIGR01509 family)